MGESALSCDPSRVGLGRVGSPVKRPGLWFSFRMRVGSDSKPSGVGKVRGKPVLPTQGVELSTQGGANPPGENRDRPFLSVRR